MYNQKFTRDDVFVRFITTRMQAYDRISIDQGVWQSANTPLLEEQCAIEKPCPTTIQTNLWTMCGSYCPENRDPTSSQPRRRRSVRSIQLQRNATSCTASVFEAREPSQSRNGKWKKETSRETSSLSKPEDERKKGLHFVFVSSRSNIARKPRF